MLRPLSIFTLLCLSIPPLAHGHDLKLVVRNLSEPGGTLNWMMFDSAQSYDAGDNSVASGRHRVTGDTIELTLHGLPDGTYAVRLFHDENNNGELDTNLLGIPREGYGFSNNSGERGPASFDDAAVAVHGDQTIEIRVR